MKKYILLIFILGFSLSNGQNTSFITAGASLSRVTASSNSTSIKLLSGVKTGMFIGVGKEFNMKNGSEDISTKSANSPVSAFEFLARKEINYDNLSEFVETVELSDLAKEQVEINAKYKVFIEREKAQIEKFKKLEKMIIPKDFDYESVKGLSNIAISGLMYGQPETIGQASRISGVTYNDISLLIAILKN